MAIRIIVDLQASPDSTTLPASIDLRQVLASNEDEEDVEITYSLNPDHNVVFDGNQKSIGFSEVTIDGSPTALDHRVRLVLGEGDPVDQVEIDQEITDGQGLTRHDVTFVIIRGGV